MLSLSFSNAANTQSPLAVPCIFSSFVAGVVIGNVVYDYVKASEADRLALTSTNPSYQSSAYLGRIKYPSDQVKNVKLAAAIGVTAFSIAAGSSVPLMVVTGIAFPFAAVSSFLTRTLVEVGSNYNEIEVAFNSTSSSS